VTNPVHLSGIGPADQSLPIVDPVWHAELNIAMSVPAYQRRIAVGEVVAKHPTFIEGWAALGDASTEVLDQYMAYRVGYHRGLDALRANGWRGSGYVRWKNPANQGFLKCLLGLADTARRIGEIGEAERCDQFLLQLDPK